MLVIPYLLAKFCIILRQSANFVESGETVYVSRFSGNDNTTCGKQSLPCRTISYAIHQALEGSHIYLDGTSTSKDPYSCQPVDKVHPGIYLKKSISFVGRTTPAYISCLHGNHWIVDGIKHKDGLRVNFWGLIFQNTSIHFFDTFVNISNCSFEDSRSVTMKFMVFSLAQFDLWLINVAFQRNAVSMLIKSYTMAKIFINMVNTSFIRNGNSNLSTSNLPSILLLESNRNYINIQLRNCSFRNNTFQGDGMISVRNTGGTIKLFLYQFNFEETSGPNCSQGVLTLLSDELILALESGFIYNTFGTFVAANSNSSDIDISNVEVDKFHSSDKRGGVFDINGSSGFLSIKDSCFRNGKSNWNGGIVAITAPNLLLTIYNCTFRNIHARNLSGVIYVKSHDWLSTKNLNDSFVGLHIINSTFSNCTSRVGGAICAELANFVATITESLFVGNRATFGGAIFLIISDSVEIRLRNVNFIENRANYSGIFVLETEYKQSSFNFTTNNVSFVKNHVNTRRPYLNGILYLTIKSEISSIVFKSTRMISNIGLAASNMIYVDLLSPTMSNSITLDTCTFKRNYGNGASFLFKGQASLVCKHSTFDSHSYLPCVQSNAFGAIVSDSRITITNSTFRNNSCGAVFIVINKNSHVKIEKSLFVRNYVPNAVGGAIRIEVGPIYDNDFNKTHIQRFRNLHQCDVLIKNVLFKENAATHGGALALANVNIKLLNSTFLNNFARSQGGQIATTFSASLTVNHCVFKQNIQKVAINGDEFIASSFLGIYSTGKLLLQNTTVDSKITSNTPLIVVSRADHVNIDNFTTITCPLGSDLKKSTYQYLIKRKKRVTVLELSCSKCGYNLYSLRRGQSKGLNVDNSFKCIPCPRGADCFSTIKSKPNFWGYNASSKPPTLAFTLCPFGYCKSPRVNSSQHNDCQGKRAGVMCGSCSDGYTEALWSTSCTPIKNCKDYWFWILFLVLVLFMAILLVFNPPIISYSVKHVLWLKRFTGNEADLRYFRRHIANSLWSLDEEDRQENTPLSSSEQLKHDKRQRSCFLEIVFYFYQIAQLLLSSSSLSEFFHTKILSPVLGFFNFEPRVREQGFLCPFPGLTPETKLAFKIVPVFGTMVAIFTIYFSHVFLNKLRRFRIPSVSSYLQASIKTIFLGYTTLATVGISLIRCVFIAGEDRWFYNGNVVCYQCWQYVSFAFNGMFVIPFIFVLAWASFKVHHDSISVTQFLLAIAFPLPFLILLLFRIVCPRDGVNDEVSENFGAIKEILLGPYTKPGNGSKHGAVYWQSVLIARRFILVLISCTVTEPSIRLFCMSLACVFVLFFHLKVKPFRNALANNVESLSLLLLIILGLINLFKSVFVGIEENIKGPLVTVSKVFHWLEIVILGLFPALVSLLACFATISLILRILFMCCRPFFKCIFRRCAERCSSQYTRSLINICEDTNVN